MLIASRRPLTRNAPIPTEIAIADAITAPISSATTNGTGCASPPLSIAIGKASAAATSPPAATASATKRVRRFNPWTKSKLNAPITAIAPRRPMANGTGRIDPAASRCDRQPMFSVAPRANVAALNAPIPASAICPSDSCPPQPVSTVTETAHSAKARITAYV